MSIQIGTSEKLKSLPFSMKTYYLQAHELLTSNVLSVLTFDLMRKDDPSSNLASDVLVVLKAKLTKEDITAESQVKIIEQLLSLSENVVFDRKTGENFFKTNKRLLSLTVSQNLSDTRFIAEITPSLKKEAVHSLSAIYRKFISENQKFQDRNAAIQYLARYEIAVYFFYSSTFLMLRHVQVGDPSCSAARRGRMESGTIDIFGGIGLFQQIRIKRNV